MLSNNAQQVGPRAILKQLKGRLVPEGAQESRAHAETRWPAIPVSITIEREGNEIQEQFLWRLADPSVNLQKTAQKICSELNLAAGSDRPVEQRLEVILKPYRAWQNLHGERLVPIQVEARVGKQLFKDEVLWDLDAPQNTPEQYACTVCQDLGLGWDFANAIVIFLTQRLAEERQQDGDRASQHPQLPASEPRSAAELQGRMKLGPQVVDIQDT